MEPENHPMFARFEKELKEELSRLEVLEMEPGMTLLKEQEYIKAVPVLLEGLVKLRKLDGTGREIVFYHIEPGESCILSITSCLNERESQAEAIIEKPSRMILVNADKVRTWMDRYPTWRKFVVSLYYQRISGLLTLLDQVIFQSVDSRLSEFLRTRSREGKLEITHQQLASELGTAREVISRLLKQMERDEIIALERGRIRILKPL
jgi:CRP/FNR family transcriptional regulator